MSTLEQLLEYQKVDGELRKIEQTIAASDERKKYMQARNFMKNAESKIAAQDARAVELKKLRDELVQRAEEIGHTIAEYADVDEMVDGGGDVAFYKKNAQALADRVRAVKGELNRLLAEINALTAEYKKMMEQGKAANKQYKEYADKFKALQNSYADKVKEINARLAELEKGIPKETIERYKQKRRENIFPVLVPLSGDFCMCGFEFPRYHQSELAGGNVVECENCRRFVYKA